MNQKKQALVLAFFMGKFLCVRGFYS